MDDIVRFVDYDSNECLMSEQNVKDIIESLFRGVGKNISITVHGKMHEGKLRNNYLGLHTHHPLFGTHDIYLDPVAIKLANSRGMRAGGNRVAPCPELAIAMVLAHEIQHANQSLLHGVKETSFYGSRRSRYLTRPSEREARQFADDSIPVLAAILGIELKKDAAPVLDVSELDDIAAHLAQLGPVSTRDIVEELKLSGINNALNVNDVKSRLMNMAVELV